MKSVLARIDGEYDTINIYDDGILRCDNEANRPISLRTKQAVVTNVIAINSENTNFASSLNHAFVVWKF